MAQSSSSPASPQWGSLAKFLVALVFAALLGWLLARFRQLIPPLGLAFILAYLLNPIVEWLTTRTRLKWGVAVTLVYLVLVLLLVAVLTVAGIAIGQQIKGLYDAVVEILPDLPVRVQNLLSQPVHLGPFTLDFSRPIAIGPFSLDFSTFDLQPLYDQLLSVIQPALQQTGTLVGSLASGTATALGWFLFILIVSYYLLHDLKSLLPSMEQVVPEGYASDVRLNLHPIIILVGAIVGASLAGITGLLLSAPVIASLRLFGGYVYRKMLDRDPWPNPPPSPTSPPKFEWPRWLRAIRPKRRDQRPQPDPSGGLGSVEDRTSEGRFAESEAQSQKPEEQSSSGTG